MKMTARPVAYIRRSQRSRTDPGDLSREFQTDTVRALAGADAGQLVILDADWRKSGATDKTDKRLDFLRLMEDVERGDVSTIYAYASDRLARSVEWSARLLNACRRAGVPIVTSEGRFEPDNQLTDQLFYFQAIQNEGYSRQATQKRLATIQKQRERGEKLGPAFYGSRPGEDLGAVLAAFDETGSANGAARLLNQRHVPTRRGGRWTHASVRQILVRAGRVPKLGVRGAAPGHTPAFRLARLLRCHCGRRLSGVVHRERARKSDGGRVESILYRCVQSESDPEHGVKSIAERRILPAIMDEADKYALPAEVEVPSTAAMRTDLEARRTQVTRLAMVPGVDLDAVTAELASIDQQLADLDASGPVEEVGPIDWENTPPAALNAQLRAYWREVRLGADLLPVDFDWRIARMRR